MTKNPKQEGSALLIVLGFLSFMVVSAVAFAIYMRTERLPSSALRRNVANRYLVRAALAQAMSRIDDAIHQDPYPGFCETGMPNNCYRDRGNNPYNWWEGRVFFPPDPEGSTRQNEPETRYAPIGDTVSVLNLEALGYLPPPLVNDVRYLSRSSWAAKWDYFNFDAGRYAFCAVNVSDYFDINALATDPLDPTKAEIGPRTSAKPVSLAYALAGSSTSYTPDQSLLTQFENLLVTQRPSSDDSMGTVPFVSMLDYNLALGYRFKASGLGSTTPVYSPFWCLINDQAPAGGDKGYTYGANNGTQSGILGAANQTYVTDTWFPADYWTCKLITGSESGSKIPDLSNSDESDSKHYGQPFKASDLRQTSADVEQVFTMRGALPFWADYQRAGAQKGVTRHLGRWDTLLLWDYLDRNNVPLSLAMPCTERVPMVAGVYPSIGTGKKLMKLKADTPNPGGAYNQASGKWEIQTTYSVDQLLDTIQPYISALVVYPFKGFDSPSYKVRAYAQVHLGAMPDVANNFTRVSDASIIGKAYDEFRKGQWKGAGKDYFMDNNQCLFSLIPEGNQSVQFDGVEREADIHELMRLQVKQPTASGKMLVTKVDQYPAKQEMVNGALTWVRGPGPKEQTLYTFGVDPLDANGNALGLVGAPVDETRMSALNFAVSMAVWVQIEDANGETVDLVPATYKDDDDLLSFGGSVGSRYEQSEAAGGRLTQPVLRFVLSDSFNLADVLNTVPPGSAADVIDIGEDKMEARGPFAYLAVDPRFNWAPENMMGVNKSVAGGLAGAAWLNHVFHEGNNSYVRRCGQGGNGDDTDCDPFMFVSNQGYLQSMGEFGFIPKLNDGNGNEMMGMSNGGYDGKLRSDATQLTDIRCMWQCNPLVPGVLGLQTVWQWGVENSSTKFGVNPYTDSADIFRAVVANTPMNYWAAGTNDMSGSKIDTMDSSKKKTMLKNVSEWKKYALGKDNDFGLDLDKSEINRLADVLRGAMRGAGYVEQGGAGACDRWTQAYDALWDSDSGLFYNENGSAETEARNLLGQTFSGAYFHCADRKSLYSFWRDSCKNRQQLFLIFVRAESTALGGAGEGTPAQQGGRAVALVWRDPETPTQTGSAAYEVERSQDQYVETRHPHKMRILFYHQFD